MIRNPLFKSTACIAIITIVSRILGFARDTLFAQWFGATPYLGAFLVAFRIPNLGRRLFAEGAFAQVFVPLITSAQHNQTQTQQKKLIGNIAGTLLLVVFAITFISIIASPLWIKVIAPGFLWHTPRFNLASHLLQIMMPYLCFITATTLINCLLNCNRRFALPATMPILLNSALIVFAYLGKHMASEQALTLLAFGVVCGGLMQLLILTPTLRTVQLWPLKLRWAWRDPSVQRLIRLMIPALIAGSVVQMGTIMDTLFASFLAKGSLTWIYFAERLYNLPLGVFGIALSTVILPHLSKQYVKKDKQAFSRGIDHALSMILIIAIPSMIILIMLAGPIITTLFHYHAFHAFDVRMTRAALRAFAIGLPAFMLIKILASACYACEQTRIPLKTAKIALGVNFIGNLALITPFQHAGLALATSMAAFVQVTSLLFVLIKRKHYQPQKDRAVFLLRLGCGALTLILWYHNMTPKLAVWLHETWQQRAMDLGLLMLSGGLIYLGTLWVLGLRRCNI